MSATILSVDDPDAHLLISREEISRNAASMLAISERVLSAPAEYPEEDILFMRDGAQNFWELKHQNVEPHYDGDPFPDELEIMFSRIVGNLETALERRHDA